MSYLIEHTILHDGLFINGHLNWFHLAFIAAALAIMFYCWKKIRNMKKEMEDLEQELSSKAADTTMGLASQKPDPSPAAPTET